MNLFSVHLTKYRSGDYIKNKDGRGMRHVWETGEVRRWVWWGNLRERDQLGDLSVGERIILRWIFKKWEWEVWTGLLWLRIGRGGGSL
jgi:hypothetical protein